MAPWAWLLGYRDDSWGEMVIDSMTAQNPLHVPIFYLRRTKSQSHNGDQLVVGIGMQTLLGTAEWVLLVSRHYFRSLGRCGINDGHCAAAHPVKASRANRLYQSWCKISAEGEVKHM